MNNLPVKKEILNEVLISREIFIFCSDVKNNTVIVIRPNHNDLETIPSNLCIFFSCFFEEISANV